MTKNTLSVFCQTIMTLNFKKGVFCTRTKTYDEYHIGRRIKKRREEKNMTIEELANKTLLSKSTISRIENEVCFPNILVLAPICIALNLNMENLVIGK